MLKKNRRKSSEQTNLQDTSDSDASVKISGASLGVGDAIGFMKEKLETEGQGEGKNHQGMEG